SDTVLNQNGRNANVRSIISGEGEHPQGSGQLQISEQSLQPTLPSEAAFFVTPKRAGGIEFIVSVGPNDARAELAHHFENLAAFIGPDPCAQPIRRVVGTLESFLWCAKGHDAEDRAEDFLLRNAAGHRHAREEGWRIPVAARRQGTLRLLELRAFLHSALHQRADFFQLRPRIDGADVGVFVEWVADAQSLDAVAKLADDGGINAFLNEESRSGAADVALVEIDPRDDAFDGLIERRVLKEDVGRFPAKFQREFRSAELLPGAFLSVFFRAELELGAPFGERPGDELANLG